MRSKHYSRSICEQFSATELSEILGCSVRTAERYRCGDTVAPKGFTELLDLRLRRRIMPEDWPDYFRFAHGKIATTSVLRPISWGHLEQYQWVLEQWHITCSTVNRLESSLMQLIPQLDAHQLKVLKKMDTLREDAKKGVAHRWPPAPKPQWQRFDGC